MHELLNTLYVTTQGATLRLDHDTVRVIVEDETRARLPLVRLQAIVVFGRVTITTPLIHRCAEDGRGVVWLTRHGRFRARLTGRTLGNVLLRRAQHEALGDPDRTLALARQYVAGKVQNARTLALRSARDSARADDQAELRAVADNLASLLGRIRDAGDLDVLRGLEGIAARAYFRGFGWMVRADRAAFTPEAVPGVPRGTARTHSCRSATRCSAPSAKPRSKALASIPKWATCTRSARGGPPWRWT